MSVTNENVSMFSGYWCGYRDKKKITLLNEEPSYVKTIQLAFAGLNPDSTMTTEFLCKNFKAEKIEQWAHELKKKGHKVLMSIIDSDAVHWWDVNLEKYAESAKETVLKKWKLDGFDIDVEGPAIDKLKIFIPKLRKVIGPEPIITFTCYTGSDDELSILETVKNDINWIQMMAYFKSFNEMIQLAQTYAKIVGKERVSIGVKVDETPLEEVKQLAEYVKINGYKGMMLWSTDMDNPNFGDKKIWEYAEQIKHGLDGNNNKLKKISSQHIQKSFLSILSESISNVVTGFFGKKNTNYDHENRRY